MIEFIDHAVALASNTTVTGNAIQFAIHGRVIGKGRPHFVKRTGVAITPVQTRDYEALVREVAIRRMDGRQPWTHPMMAIIVAHFPIPPSWSKTKKLAAQRQLISPSKPDCDNIAKILLDSCCRLVYIDDAQVTNCFIFKRFGETARLDVRFMEA